MRTNERTNEGCKMQHHDDDELDHHSSQVE
jgi:hypothetical protein